MLFEKIVINNEEEYLNFLKENVMDTKDAMAFLGITTRGGLSYLVTEGKLEPFFDKGRVRLFTKREVERYKKERDGN